MTLFRTSGHNLALILFFMCLTVTGFIHLLPSGTLRNWALAHIMWLYLAGLFLLAYFLLDVVIAKMRHSSRTRPRSNNDSTESTPGASQ